jgi:hypothetical protein
VIVWKKAMKCRCCGAVRAYPGTAYGLCYACERRYDYFCVTRGDSADNFNKFLVNQLSLQVARKKRGQVVGRCEAISKHAARVFLQNFQCGAIAVKIKDGRKLCAKHLGTSDIKFVDEIIGDYDYLTDLMTWVAADNKEFRSVIKNVAASLP